MQLEVCCLVTKIIWYLQLLNYRSSEGVVWVI